MPSQKVAVAVLWLSGKKMGLSSWQTREIATTRIQQYSFASFDKTSSPTTDAM
jgi:hypothetical protein